mgnify:CR=1 FL=1
MKIAINNLSFSYDKLEVLSGINLDFTQKEIVGIIGPNGSGKSTLLKCVGGEKNE